MFQRPVRGKTRRTNSRWEGVNGCLQAIRSIGTDRRGLEAEWTASSEAGGSDRRIRGQKGRRQSYHMCEVHSPLLLL